MKVFKKLASAAAAGMLLIAATGVTQAATLDTTSATMNDGILQNFTGIDWHSNGAGWVQGFDLTSANKMGDTDTFTFKYQAFAGVIDTTSVVKNLYVAPPGSATGGYELTTYATLNETATCLNNGCSIISIQTNNGTFQIFFDNHPNANQAAGTGFTDGVQIIAGNYTAGGAVFSAASGGGGTLSGTVTSTNAAYVAPNLLGTALQESLIFPALSDFTRPALFNGASTGTDSGTNFVLQTDSSQTFTSANVPEPATTFLFGAGFMGIALFRRRKQK